MIKLYQPFPKAGEVKVKGVCENIFDKGKAAVIHTKITGTTADGNQIFDTKYIHFYIGEGGFGGDSGPKTEPLDPPGGVKPRVASSLLKPIILCPLLSIAPPASATQ